MIHHFLQLMNQSHPIPSNPLPERNGNNNEGKWRNKSSFKHHLYYAFMLMIFAHFLAVSGQSWDGVIITQEDHQALVAIKRGFLDYRGILRSWNDSDGNGACSGGWAGIKCVKGHVIAIQLPWKALGGHISEKIGQLRSLRKLSLHDNVLTGTIPISLGLLPNLRGIYLFNNRFSGSVPPSIGKNPSLQALDLSNNQLTGTIPLGIATNSTRLYRFNLSHNSIMGSIPITLTSSPSLIFLALEHNNLSGIISNTWGASAQLKTMTLDHNLLSGTIPFSLSKLGMLEVISLGHNQIAGTIPNELGSLTKLKVLDLSNNNINGTTPSTLGRLHNLSVLNLENNHLNGQIPASIGNISSLTQLDFSGNNLTGEIPNSLAKLPNLTQFNVSHNHLSGQVPSPLPQKFNASSFAGNIQLCGFSVSSPCPSPPPQIPPSPSPEATNSAMKHHKHRNLSTKDIILIASGSLLLILLLLCCILLCCLIRKRAAAKAKGEKNAAKAGGMEKGVPATGIDVESGGDVGGKLVHFDGPFVFTADDLLCATAEIMGKSNYGTAYKATLEDGNLVAVKRLREKMAKGQKEFEAEVGALGKMRHPNILAMRAYYLGPKGEKLLVFDYMANGSLASFLHARGPETSIPWATRMNIAMGITRGLCYLHDEEKIIHGNLTSSNVLLDEKNNAKIADVGLSKLMTTAANTNVIATAGTMGYRAPELSKLKNATSKTDIYSLGVIILELLTGKSPSEATDGLDLPQWVASIVKEEWTNEVFDVELMRGGGGGDGSTTADELLNTLKLALHCVDPSPAARPEAQLVLQQLEEIKPELVLAAAIGDDDDDDAAAKEVPLKSE